MKLMFTMLLRSSFSKQVAFHHVQVLCEGYAINPPLKKKKNWNPRRVEG